MTSPTDPRLSRAADLICLVNYGMDSGRAFMTLDSIRLDALLTVVDAARALADTFPSVELRKLVAALPDWTNK